MNYASVRPNHVARTKLIFLFSQVITVGVIVLALYVAVQKSIIFRALKSRCSAWYILGAHRHYTGPQANIHAHVDRAVEELEDEKVKA